MSTNRFKIIIKDRQSKELFDKEEVFVSLALRIAEIRRKEGLTQRELAKRLKITEKAVSTLEDTNNRRLTLNMLFKLAEAMNKELKIELK